MLLSSRFNYVMHPSVSIKLKILNIVFIYTVIVENTKQFSACTVTLCVQL